jgi:hypothetical protein
VAKHSKIDGTLRAAPRCKRIGQVQQRSAIHRGPYSSAILPAWSSKSPKVAEVSPLLHLHGLSSRDFTRRWRSSSAPTTMARSASDDPPAARASGQMIENGRWGGARSRNFLSSSFVRTEPLMIAGLAGPVVVESPFWANRFLITVGGQPATRTGRGRYSLPGAGGGVREAIVRGGFLDMYPTLEINGVRHRTGPVTPLPLRALALLPIALLLLGGVLGGIIGALGVAVNRTVARLPVHAVVKALLMVCVLAVAAVVWVSVAAAITAAAGR